MNLEEARQLAEDTLHQIRIWRRRKLMPEQGSQLEALALALLALCEQVRQQRKRIDKLLEQRDDARIDVEERDVEIQRLDMALKGACVELLPEEIDLDQQQALYDRLLAEADEYFATAGVVDAELDSYEAEATLLRLEAAGRDAEIERLRDALDGLMACVKTNGEGLLYAEFDEWAKPWCEAVAVRDGAVGDGGPT